VLFSLAAHFLGHGIFGQIEELLPVFRGVLRIIASLIDGGAPIVD
jgi:hypothetical protein